MIVPWLALAVALWLVPVPVAAAARARFLTQHPRGGRLGSSGVDGSAEVDGVDGSVVLGAPAGGTRVARPVLRGGVVVVAGVAVVAASTATLGLGLGLATAVAVLTGADLVRAGVSGRAERRRHEQLRAAVRILTGEIEAGARPVGALAAAGESAPAFRAEFSAAARAAAAGRPVADVLARSAELSALGHAWRVSESGGAALGEVLAGVANDLAARTETRRAVAAAVAGARSSAGLLAGLPVLGVGLGAAMGAHPLAFLAGSGTGHLAACLGVVLDALGVLWTQRLIRRAAR